MKNNTTPTFFGLDDLITLIISLNEKLIVINNTVTQNATSIPIDNCLKKVTKNCLII